MTPKIVGYGKSFKGAGMYVLHDPDQATTKDRVAWTETRNLGTDDADVAWRVMAATAMKQAELKKKAGIPNTGRKSSDHVMHLILAWHGEEKADLTQDEMMRALNGALRSIGADDRQALIAAHNDKEFPHLHAIINRVSTEDGRMLNPSHSKLKLSKWAEEYEKDRGKIYCPKRVANNAARERRNDKGKRGWPPSDSRSKHIARHIYELEAANQNKPGFEKIRQQQKKLDAALSQKDRAQQARRGKAWKNLQDAREKSLRAIREQTARKIRQAEGTVSKEFRPRWLELHGRQRDELAAFENREKSLLGRLRNMAGGVDLKGMMRAATRREALNKSYNTVASAGKRREEFLARQKVEEQRLERQENAAKKAREVAIRRDQRQKAAERRTLFLAERRSLMFKHDMEDVKDRKAWKQRNDDRRVSYEQARDKDTTSAQHSGGPGRQAVNDNSAKTKRPMMDEFRRAAKRQDELEQDRAKNKDNDPSQDRGPGD